MGAGVDGVVGAGVVGAGVVGAGVVGAGVVGAGVVGAGVVAAGVDGAAVVGSGVVGSGSDELVASGLEVSSPPLAPLPLGSTGPCTSGALVPEDPAVTSGSPSPLNAPPANSAMAITAGTTSRAIAVSIAPRRRRHHGWSLLGVWGALTGRSWHKSDVVGQRSVNLSANRTPSHAGHAPARSDTVRAATTPATSSTTAVTPSACSAVRRGPAGTPYSTPATAAPPTKPPT